MAQGGQEDVLEGLGAGPQVPDLDPALVGEAEHGNLWRYVLCALVVLLILEQLLAWSASYHPRAAAVPAVAKGGAR